MPLMSANIPLKVKVDYTAIVDVPLLWTSKRMEMPMKKKCGMMIAGLPHALSHPGPDAMKPGPMTCVEPDESWDDLEILPVGSKDPKLEMEVERATTVKDMT